MTKQKLIDRLDSFTKAYIVCALWSSNDDKTPSGGEPLDKNYTIFDLTMDALKSIKQDCENFQREHGALLATAYGVSPYDEPAAGHDFWLTRCHHGVGFWDRGLGEVGEALTKAAHAYGEANLYVQRGSVGIE